MKRLYNYINREELKEKIQNDTTPRKVFSFYRYFKIEEPEKYRDDLYKKFNKHHVLGRIYVSHEGVNAQITVPEKKAVDFKKAFYSFKDLYGTRLNEAIEHRHNAFFKLTVKVRENIVADGLKSENFDVTNGGQHLDAESFNKLTDQEKAVLVDMRNHYETEVGHFEGAILPEAVTFREALPEVEEKIRDRKDRPVVMYCTGGIRCEKASAWLKHQGFSEVYQLDGGIIEYARQVREKGLKNKFIGKNFVFDERLGERITEDVLAECHQCGSPCDDHTNCANDECHLLFIQCKTCKERFNGCCSYKCKSYSELPDEQRMKESPKPIFNGTLYDKHRYKKGKLLS